MLKWIVNNNTLKHFLLYLIIFIFPSIASASAICDRCHNNNNNNNIHSNIVGNELRHYDIPSNIKNFLTKHLTAPGDNNDKYTTDTSVFGISFPSYNPFNILLSLPTYLPSKPPAKKAKLSNSFNRKHPSGPPPHNRYCKLTKGKSTRGEPKYKLEDKEYDHNFNGNGNNHHYSGCGKHTPGFKPFLSDLLLQNILERYGHLCNATILTSGFMSLSNNYTNLTALFEDPKNYQLLPPQRKIMLTSPSLLIQCSNDTNSERPYHAINNNFTKFLIEIAHNYTNEYVIDNSSSMVYKDNFNNSVLIIFFCQTVLCISAWMIYLILLLLPMCNYNNNRDYFVHIYVLFYAITRSVFLAKAYNGILKWEYEHCIQDSSKYGQYILGSNGFKVCALILNILSNVNWAYIVIFMYSVDTLENVMGRSSSTSTSSVASSSLLEKRYSEIVPEIKNIIFDNFKEWTYNPKNKKILYVIIACIVLFSINNTFFAIVLWNKTRNDFRMIYKTSEILIYTLFIWRISLFILRNFGMTITSTRTVDPLNFDEDSITTTCSKNNRAFLKNQIQLDNLEDRLKHFKRWASNTWKNYFNIVPLLIYNIIIFILSYLMVIYFTPITAYKYEWKYNLVYFTKLLITVNFWGFIDVLNKRETYLRKKTILGRRINNQDNFFVDPCSSIYSNSPSEQSDYDFNCCENNHDSTSTNIMTISSSNSSKNKFGNNSIQQYIDDKSKEKNKNMHKIAYKYTIFKPIKSLKPKFNRIKERRIQFILENYRKK